MSISVNSVTKFYGSQKALDNVSFEISSGEIVGFLGPNGAGKSTIMKIITGFVPASSGEVLINGMEIRQNSIEVSKNIGYLPENNPLYLDMYIREYLEFVAGLYKLGRSKNERIDKMIEQTGLVEERRKKIGQLSKGYRQRVGLAQALIHDPEVLILDEPTSGLDPNQIIEIRNLISTLGKEKTVLLSTHIMQEVEAICDKVIIINNGKIVANEAISEIHKQTPDTGLTIIVEFNKSPVRADLEKIVGVTKVLQTDSQNWLIQSAPHMDIRPDIFQFAVDNKLTVLSMQKREKSLEDVFQELTN